MTDDTKAGETKTDAALLEEFQKMSAIAATAGTEVLAALTTADLAALTTAEITGLVTGVPSALTTDQLSPLTTAQVSGLTAALAAPFPNVEATGAASTDIEPAAASEMPVPPMHLTDGEHPTINRIQGLLARAMDEFDDEIIELVEAVPTSLNHPSVGKYKDEVLAWLRGLK